MQQVNRRGADGEFWDLNTTAKYKEITMLLWNIRGAGSNEFVPHLKSLLHMHNPGIVILLETKAGEDRANQVMKHMVFVGIKLFLGSEEREKFGCFGEIMYS